MSLKWIPSSELLVALLLISVGTSILLAPVCRYVVVGWKAKRKDIMDGLDSKARLAYFKMFNPSEARPQSEAAASAAFESLYAQWYGRRYFVVPTLLFLLVGLSGVTLAVFTALHERGYIENAFFDIPVTALAAIAGAYLWVTNDHIRRSRRLR